MGAGVLRKIVGHAPGSKSAIVSTLIEAQKADVHTENNELRCDVVDVAVPHRKKYYNFLGHKITNTTHPTLRAMAWAAAHRDRVLPHPLCVSLPYMVTGFLKRMSPPCQRFPVGRWLVALQKKN